jgi:hypothetical protein
MKNGISYNTVVKNKQLGEFLPEEEENEEEAE